MLERIACETLKAPISANGFLGQPRAREQQSDPAAPTLAEEIRPALRLHDDAERWTHAIEKSAHGTRHVVGQINITNRVAEQALDTLHAGRRAGGYDDGTVRTTLLALVELHRAVPLFA